MRFLFFFLAVTLYFPSNLFAGSIPSVARQELSDRDLSPTAKTAMSFSPNLWRHAETEHFIYHFTDEKSAETVYIHAEVYYGWIKELFGVKEDSWKRKCQVFIFEDKKIWEDFKKRIGRDMPEGTAFTSGFELFIYRDPFWLSPKKTLAHEITHVILFRFLEGNIPLFLNEGFAEYMSLRAIATQFEGNEFRVRTLQLIPEEKWLPLPTLVSMNDYPAQDVGFFYQESELLVRFLITQHGGKKFYDLLHEVSRGKLFDRGLETVYGMNLETFEKKFKITAIKK